MNRLTFESYRDLLCDELDLVVTKDAGPDASLEDDLGMDSFSVFELVVLTEQLASLAVPPADLPPLVTLGDAFAYYLSACEAAELENSV